MLKLRLIGCLMLMLCCSMSFAALPLTVQVVNNTAVDIVMRVVEFRHLDFKAIHTFEDQRIYGGETHTFTFDRTDDPAELSVIFRAAGVEQEISGYNIGEWEYIEFARTDVTTVFVAETCHNVSGNAPFDIECLGNSSFLGPRVVLNINYEGTP